MPAYFRSSVKSFLATQDEVILARLATSYSNDGYASQYTSATIAWGQTLQELRRELLDLLVKVPLADTWQILLEYPLYRLRRRIDAVILTPEVVLVLELKTGATSFEPTDKRQVEEYAQDLRDFHSESRNMRLVPVLWAFGADSVLHLDTEVISRSGVGKLRLVGRTGLASVLAQIIGKTGFLEEIQSEKAGWQWDTAIYEPVPSVIDAAITLFSGHGVREIALAGAKNLDEAASAVFSIINLSRSGGRHSVVFLTGVPGAGKTLAGLNIVHNAMEKGLAGEGDVVYLSGNTPLVVVLREALARDQYQKAVATGKKTTVRDCRASTRASIQHINDFLKEYVQNSVSRPSGHVIVFDEAQRAWDERQGREKFGRNASEPLLVLETMARHVDWSVTVCLIGLGQEINDGEEGVAGWAQAISHLCARESISWNVYAPDFVFGVDSTTQTLGQLPAVARCVSENALHLDVPMRSFRSPKLGDWITALLECDHGYALSILKNLNYPLWVTRSLAKAKFWLHESTLGERRMGLLASSGARRLRADGVGEVLSATDGPAIAHWYLNPRGDIRSSFALEVPANEYTSQGLELDFACLCWGGDLIFRDNKLIARALAGNRWNEISDPKRASFIFNSYRVLLSRAREGLVIWIPKGDTDDHTRDPKELDSIANFLIRSGVRELM